MDHLKLVEKSRSQRFSQILRHASLMKKEFN